VLNSLPHQLNTHCVVSRPTTPHGALALRIRGCRGRTTGSCLLKVDRRAVRDFYEIEAIRNGWSVR